MSSINLKLFFAGMPWEGAVRSQPLGIHLKHKIPPQHPFGQEGLRGDF
jgi:hypothetical protein